MLGGQYTVIHDIGPFGQHSPVPGAFPGEFGKTLNA
jgi:hypothetical protein